MTHFGKKKTMKPKAPARLARLDLHPGQDQTVDQKTLAAGILQFNAGQSLQCPGVD
jgi:hypothetical protein